MASKRAIAKDLDAALRGEKELSIDLYVEVLADHEDALKASLDRDADDALLCMLADDGNVAMLLIDWQGTIHRNDNIAFTKYIWLQFRSNLFPILSYVVIPISATSFYIRTS